MVTLPKPVKTVVLEVTKTAPPPPSYDKQQQVFPEDDNVSVPSSGDWTGVRDLLKKARLGRNDAIRIVELTDELDSAVVSQPEEKMAEAAIKLTKSVFEMSGHDTLIWFKEKAKLENIVLVHQVCICLFHMAGIHRTFLLDIIDDCSEYISSIVSEEGLAYLERIYQSPGTLSYMSSGSLSQLLDINQFDRFVPYVVKTLRDNYFHVPFQR